MTPFESKRNALFQELGVHQTMVLSTSLHDRVTSRMMSVILIDGTFYFQTDFTFRKYDQIRQNPFVALCAGNLQIEGTCRELGPTSCHKPFCELFQRHFPNSWERYTGLAQERLFAVTPLFIQRWIYEEGKPFVERLDFAKSEYSNLAYHGT